VSDVRLYILGLNQPQTGHPPLDTRPVGSAGHRLWRMVSDVSDMTEEDWLEQTQRVNILSGEALPKDYRSASRNRGDYIGGMIQRRTVLLLGEVVANAMRHDEPPFVWARDRDWITIPHPSGKNLFYNNPVHRAAAGLLIRDIVIGLAQEPRTA